MKKFFSNLIAKLNTKQRVAALVAIALLIVIAIVNMTKSEEKEVVVEKRITPIEKILYPMRQSFYISFPGFSDFEVRPSTNYSIDYEIPNADKLGEIEVSTECFDGYTARIEKINNSKGVIHITTPDTLKFSEVYLMASRKNETPVLYSINMRKRITVSIPATVFAAKIMDKYHVDLPLDMTEYIVSIPTNDRYWIESEKGDSIGLDYKDLEKADEEEENKDSFVGQVKQLIERVRVAFSDESLEDYENYGDPSIVAPTKKDEEKRYENVLSFKIYSFPQQEGADSAIRHSIVRLLNEHDEVIKTIFITQSNVAKLSVKMDTAGKFEEKIFLGDFESVQSLKIEGPMDSTDFSKLRHFKELKHLDLSGVNIKSISWQLYLKELVSVILPESLTELTNGAFKESYNLKRVEMANVEKIGEMAFCDCKQLDGVKFPQTLKYIGNFAFSGCSSLSNIRLPESTDSLGRSAFARCKSLSDVQLTEGIKSISHYAFGECTSLKSIFIPSSVVYIGERVFYGCEKLTRFSSKLSPDGRALIVDNVLRAVTTSGLTQYTIPSSVQAIGEFAFFQCANLKNIVIPSSVTEIRNSAFFGCKGLTDINIPTSVNRIKTTAFAYCTGLRKIKFPESVTVVESWAFDGCSNLSEVELSSSTTNILDYAFTGCHSLLAFKIPDQTNKIGNYSFSGTGLVKMEIPEKVSSLGRAVFQECLDLEELNCTSATPPVVDSILGSSLNKLNAIFVPQKSVETYKSTIGWKEHSLKAAQN